MSSTICSDLDEVVGRLQQGQVGVFPFDTIWGLIGDLSQSAATCIRELKGRDSSVPLSLVVPSIIDVDQWVDVLSDQQISDLAEWWPGPVTALFSKSELVPDFVSSGPLVGIRCPLYQPLNYVLNAIRGPLLTTSVNRTGQAFWNGVGTPDLFGEADFWYTGDSPFLGHESTLVDMSVDPYRVVRGEFIGVRGRG